jgi:serine/threonine-protein kinase RsbT
MQAARSSSLSVTAESDIVKVRQAARAATLEMKCSLVDQTKVVTAASELARNLLVYGGGGEVLIEFVEEGLRRGLRITFKDDGPGIPDIELALKDGFTSGKGMGLGLGGAKRLVNDFEIHSKAGEGTRVTITKWK